MPGRLTPLGVITKWLIVPALIGVVGYFILGPAIVRAQHSQLVEPSAAPPPTTEDGVK